MKKQYWWVHSFSMYVHCTIICEKQYWWDMHSNPTNDNYSRDIHDKSLCPLFHQSLHNTVKSFTKRHCFANNRGYLLCRQEFRSEFLKNSDGVCLISPWGQSREWVLHKHSCIVYDRNLVSVSATETKIKSRHGFQGQKFFCLNLNFPPCFLPWYFWFGNHIGTE